jgi:flagellin-like hook-associated protein FlgL
VAIIRYLLDGNTVESPQNEGYAREAISVTQMFAQAAASINEKLERMEELAEQATGTHSKKKLEAMQAEFEQLADEINEIVRSAEHNGNKLLSAEGTTISISIGNGSTIDIVSRDLSIDIDGLDLTTDAEGALAAIRTSVSQSSYYSGYLADQADRLENSISLVEFEADNSLGFEAQEDDFDIDLARLIAAYALSLTVEGLSVLFEAQANVEGERAVRLLYD